MITECTYENHVLHRYVVCAVFSLMNAGPYGTQENIIHFVLRNKLDKTARYLIRNMRGYDHLFLEQDKNHRTPFDLAHSAGFSDLESDINQKVYAKVIAY